MPNIIFFYNHSNVKLVRSDAILVQVSGLDSYDWMEICGKQVLIHLIWKMSKNRALSYTMVLCYCFTQFQEYCNYNSCI